MSAFTLSRLAKWAERIVYRAGGLPVTIAALTRDHSGAAAVIRNTYARHYWTIESWHDPVDILVAALILVPGILLSAAYFTWRNGDAIARRSGVSLARQFAQQLGLAWSHGILPPWYYVFALHEPARRAVAWSFLQRGETKLGVFNVLQRRRSSWSPLGDKNAFAEHCDRWQLPNAAVLGIAYPDRLRLRCGTLPDTDLFIKPIDQCGGKGAERWNHVGNGDYVGPGGVQLSARRFEAYLMGRAASHPVLIQPRLVTHPELADIANGALATVRILSCLDEQEQPELMGAIFRMAVGDNHTVDNLHAGGLASEVDLATGRLSAATNLGMDAQVGWMTRHPDSGAAIEGRIIPHWQAACALAKRAHAAFGDRLLVGWDVAILAEGPCLVEGNYGPDVDIMQRHVSIGLCGQRFGQLLAWHLLNGCRGDEDRLPVHRR